MLNLRHKPISSIGSKFGFENVDLGLRILPRFPQFIKAMGNWDF